MEYVLLIVGAIMGGLVVGALITLYIANAVTPPF